MAQFKRFFSSVVIFIFLMKSLAVYAANLIVDNNGQLLGANNIDINGQLFSVEFIDSSCIGAYNGCNTESDFTFNTLTDAIAASQALLDQVLINEGGYSYDDDPTLTFGCSNNGVCVVITAYGLTEVEGITKALIGASFNRNLGSPDGDDTVVTGVQGINDDFSAVSIAVYAVWTPQPLNVPTSHIGTVVLGFILLYLSKGRSGFLQSRQ